MLGRLKMCIDDCIDAYLGLSDRIFQKKRHRVTLKGKIQGRFASDEPERAVKEVIEAQGFPDLALMVVGWAVPLQSRRGRPTTWAGSIRNKESRERRKVCLSGLLQS